MPNPLVKEVVFSVPQIKKDISLEIKDLYKIINQQKIIINKLNERVSILEEKEKEREEKERKEKEKEREENEKKEKDQFFICENSKKIHNDKEKDLAIRKWIDPNKKDFKFKLLFRMSRDGNQSSIYHNLCDNQENLLTIIETDNNLKFGGFSSQSWGIPGLYIDKTFMFSLNKMKKFERLNNNKSMHNRKSYGPVFGNG